jgi:hypothetical protein
MKNFIFLFVLISVAHVCKAQDDIVLDLDSIKNIKTTRYSSVNEVGVGINIGYKVIFKLPGTTNKTKQDVEKPNVIFRTVHGVLINPKLFIGAGVGVDFLPTNTGGTASNFHVTFPFFAEFREYILDGNFNVFFSERLGVGVSLDQKLNVVSNQSKTSTGAFGEFMIGGRYVPGGKKLAVHFGVGYRLQHLQRKADIVDPSLPTNVINGVKQITIKHYIPVTIGITF